MTVGAFRLPADTPEFCALGIPLGSQTFVATQAPRSATLDPRSRNDSPGDLLGVSILEFAFLGLCTRAIIVALSLPLVFLA